MKLGINQRELGMHVGVNQSTITKIENGKIRPSYELVYSIFRFLESFEDSSIGLIGDIQVTPVIFVDKSEKLRRAISMMQNRGLKQLPVKDVAIRLVVRWPPFRRTGREAGTRLPRPRNRAVAARGPESAGDAR